MPERFRGCERAPFRGHRSPPPRSTFLRSPSATCGFARDVSNPSQSHPTGPHSCGRPPPADPTVIHATPGVPLIHVLQPHENPASLRLLRRAPVPPSRRHRVRGGRRPRRCDARLPGRSVFAARATPSDRTPTARLTPKPNGPQSPSNTGTNDPVDIVGTSTKMSRTSRRQTIMTRECDNRHTRGA